MLLTWPCVLVTAMVYLPDSFRNDQGCNSVSLISLGGPPAIRTDWRQLLSDILRSLASLDLITLLGTVAVGESGEICVVEDSEILKAVRAHYGASFI